MRTAGNDYSVNPAAIGQLVEVRTSLSRVQVTRSGQVLASHDRCWSSRQTLTDPEHVAAAAILRRAFQQGPPADPGHPVRDLSDYDRDFDVDFTEPSGADGEVA